MPANIPLANGFGIAFDSAELSGDHDAGVGFELKGFREERGGVDVSVAVDLTVAEEGGVFEAGDELRTRFCSPYLRWFWKPTRLYESARRFSWRSWTTA